MLKINLMKNLFFLLIITLIILNTYTSGFFCVFNRNETKTEDAKISEIQTVSAHNIKLSNTIKTNFYKSIEHCKRLNIAQNGAFETCQMKFIFQNSQTDYYTLIQISNYCENITNTEHDKRECIDEYFN